MSLKKVLFVAGSLAIAGSVSGCALPIAGALLSSAASSDTVKEKFSDLTAEKKGIRDLKGDLTKESADQVLASITGKVADYDASEVRTHLLLAFGDALTGAEIKHTWEDEGLVINTKVDDTSNDKRKSARVSWLINQPGGGFLGGNIALVYDFEASRWSIDTKIGGTVTGKLKPRAEAQTAIAKAKAAEKAPAKPKKAAKATS